MLLVALAAIPDAGAAEEAGWVGVKKFSQGEVSRKTSGAVQGIRARGTIAAPWAKVREVVLAPSKFAEVMPHLEEERFLAGEGCTAGATTIPGCRVIWVYNRFNPPLVARRDVSLRVELVRDGLADGGELQLTWLLDASHGPPPKEGLTHMVVNRGSWTLTADGASTRYTYEIEIDPGGSIPAWATNVANQSEVPRVIGAIERAAKSLETKDAGSGK